MSPQRNRLLARLDPGSLAGLEPHLKPIRLPLRFAIEDPGRQIEHAYFMDAGIASVATSTVVSRMPSGSKTWRAR